MTDLVQFELEDGSSVLIEAEPVGGQRVTRGGRVAAEMISKADETFEQALGRMGPTATGRHQSEVIRKTKQHDDFVAGVEVFTLRDFRSGPPT
jgi:hypothetical protein